MFLHLPLYYHAIVQPLDLDGAAAAMATMANQVNEGREIEMTVDEVAYGFIRVANEAMCRPIRALTQVRGHLSVTSSRFHRNSSIPILKLIKYVNLGSLDAWVRHLKARFGKLWWCRRAGLCLLTVACCLSLPVSHTHICLMAAACV